MRVALVVLMSWLPGCGRLAFDQRLDERPDGDLSEAVDANNFVGDGPPPCTHWSAWSTPTKMPAVLESNTDDWSLTPSQDGALFVFFSFRASSAAAALWQATYDGSTFSAPQRIAELDTADSERHPTLRVDKLEMLYSVQSMTTNFYELWSTTRASASDAWGAPVVRGELNSAADDAFPWFQSDNVVWFSSNRPGTSGYDLFTASRPDRTSPFGAPVRVSELSSNANDDYVTTSADGLEVMFTSQRTGGPGGYDVYTSHRATLSNPFDPPTLVSELSSNRDERAPRLTPDGTTVYLNYDIPIPSGGAADFYSATRTCLP